MRKEKPNLGTLLKIAHITSQRKYLEAIFVEKILHPAEDGDPTFRYVGHIFPENMEWLKENGFEVFCNRVIDSDSPCCGVEDYIITPAKTIELTEEEYENSKNQFEYMRLNAIKDMIKNFEEILNLPVNIVDDEDSDDEFDDEFDDEEETFENQIENYINELRKISNEDACENEDSFNEDFQDKSSKDVSTNEENFADGAFADSCDDGDFADSCDDGDFICENSDYIEEASDAYETQVTETNEHHCGCTGSCKCGGNCNGSCHCGGSCGGNCKCGEHTEADDCDRECYE